jgi:isochorismate hydrolase
MKELYYDFGNIDIEAQSFLKAIKPYRTKHQLPLFAKKTALLVIDMQNHFGDEVSQAFIPSIKAIVPKIKLLQETFLRNSLTIIQTQHIDSSEKGPMHKWWLSNLETNNPKAKIISELSSPKIPVLIKTQYDAFWQTDLEAMLKNSGIEQIIITGVMTHLCCETTARSAFMRGFDVFFCIDGTATYNRKFHLGSLINLAHGFAIPLLVKEAIAGLT